ncbi:MAG: helix-turn-helix transcriptional regulator [Thermomicrobiales bacterium]|nr:helix-turn-helix transcriptional regulator [Thermomicrobiales bacterium]
MPRPRRSDRLTDDIAELCEERIVHIQAVQAARQTLPDTPTVARLSDLFSALGDPTRLRIVAALSGQELCVCDLAATVGLTESAISHQLRHLRQLGLVRARRDGRLVYYLLDDDHIGALYSQAVDHIAHTPLPRRETADLQPVTAEQTSDSERDIL